MPNNLPFLLDVNAGQYTFQVIDADDIKSVIDRAKDREKFMFRGMYIRKENLPYLLPLRDAVERPQK
jgi:hypothetical protein